VILYLYTVCTKNLIENLAVAPDKPIPDKPIPVITATKETCNLICPTGSEPDPTCSKCRYNLQLVIRNQDDRATVRKQYEFDFPVGADPITMVNIMNHTITEVYNKEENEENNGGVPLMVNWNAKTRKFEFILRNMFHPAESCLAIGHDTLLPLNKDTCAIDETNKTINPIKYLLGLNLVARLSDEMIVKITGDFMSNKCPNRVKCPADGIFDDNCKDCIYSLGLVDASKTLDKNGKRVKEYSIEYPYAIKVGSSNRSIADQINLVSKLNNGIKVDWDDNKKRFTLTMTPEDYKNTYPGGNKDMRCYGIGSNKLKDATSCELDVKHIPKNSLFKLLELDPSTVEMMDKPNFNLTSKFSVSEYDWGQGLAPMSMPMPIPTPMPV
jgi:hypothetical protein